jgi:hypothetical protein
MPSHLKGGYHALPRPHHPPLPFVPTDPNLLTSPSRKNSFATLHASAHLPEPITLPQPRLKNIWAIEENLYENHQDGEPQEEPQGEHMGHSRRTYTTTEMNSDPLTKSLTSHTCHPLCPEDIFFSSSVVMPPSLGKQGTNIVNPEYDHKCIRRAMEHAIAIAHRLEPHTSSATILVLPH